MGKRTIYLLIILFLLNGIFHTTSFSVNVQANSEFAGGSGRSSDPYIITTPTQLERAIKNSGTSHYSLGNDIDLSTFGNWNVSPEFFRGTFDGRGYKVTGLQGSTGLFAYVTGEVRNVGLENFHVRGNVVGALVNQVWEGSGVIKNAYVASGTVENTNNTAGGAAGANRNIMENIYALNVDVKGPIPRGGLIGVLSGKLSNSYVANGRVHGGGSQSGGIAGKNNDYSGTGVVENSYWNTTCVSCSFGFSMGEEKTSAELKQQNTFSGWDFGSIWDIDPNINDGFPFLRTPKYKANLNTLELNDQSISGFRGDTYDYDVFLEEGVDSIKFNATTADSRTSIIVNGSVHSNEETLTLQPGYNKISIQTIVADGGEDQTVNYTVNITVKDPPKAPQNMSIIDLQTAYKGNVQVSLSWDEPINWGSHPSSKKYIIEFSKDGNNWDQLASNHLNTTFNYTLPTDINTNEARFRVKSVTNDGESNYVESDTFIIDNTNPSLTITPSTVDTTHEDITLTVSGSDEHSGIKRIKTPADQWIDDSEIKYTVKTNGTYEFVVEDNVGNTTTKSITINNIDKTISFDQPTIGSFEPIVLQDQPIAMTTNISPITIKDWRDGSNEWRLDVSASPLTLVEEPFSLSAGTIKLKSVSINRVSVNGSGDLPKQGFTKTEEIDNGQRTVVISDKSRGEYEIIFPSGGLEIMIDPTTAKVGQYKSTITWELVNAP